MLQRVAHPNTKTMLDAWKRMDAPAGPSALAPSVVSEDTDLIANLFLLRKTREDTWIFSSAGDGMSEFLGRALVDHNLLGLMMGPDRAMLSGFLTSVEDSKRPGLLRTRGETLAGRHVDIEMALAPLPEDRSGAPRMLGLYQPLGGEGLLEGRPIWTHRVLGLWPPERPAAKPKLRLVAQQY